jgi:hypothetical protein
MLTHLDSPISLRGAVIPRLRLPVTRGVFPPCREYVGVDGPRRVDHLTPGGEPASAELLRPNGLRRPVDPHQERIVARTRGLLVGDRWIDFVQ